MKTMLPSWYEQGYARKLPCYPQMTPPATVVTLYCYIDIHQRTTWSHGCSGIGAVRISRVTVEKRVAQFEDYT